MGTTHKLLVVGPSTGVRLTCYGPHPERKPNAQLPGTSAPPHSIQDVPDWVLRRSSVATTGAISTWVQWSAMCRRHFYSLLLTDLWLVAIFPYSLQRWSFGGWGWGTYDVCSWAQRGCQGEDVKCRAIIIGRSDKHGDGCLWLWWKQDQSVEWNSEVPRSAFLLHVFIGSAMIIVILTPSSL